MKPRLSLSLAGLVFLLAVTAPGHLLLADDGITVHAVDDNGNAGTVSERAPSPRGLIDAVSGFGRGIQATDDWLPPVP